MLLNLLNYYFLFIFGTAFFYFLGTLILELIGFRSFYSSQQAIFLKLIIGVIAFVFFYSTYITNFATINIAFGVIGIFVFWYLKTQSKNLVPVKISGIKFFRNEKLIDFIPLILYSAFWMIWEGFNFLEGLEASDVTVPFDDALFYANIAGFMNLTGNENPFLSYSIVTTSYTGITPYHYFEVWLAAGYAKLFGTLPLYGLLLFSYPLFLTLCSAGINLVFSFFFKQNILSYIVSPFLIFITGVNIFDVFQSTNAFENLNPTLIPKYGVIILFLLCFILNVLNNISGILLIVPLLCLTIAYSTTFPVLVIFYLLLFLFGKKYLFQSFRKPHMVVFLILFGIVAFSMFHFLNIKAKTLTNISINEYLYHPLTPIKIAGKTTLQLMALYFIFLFPFVLACFNKYSYYKSLLKQPVILFLCMLAFCSLLAWMVLYPIFDSIQFFTATGITSINILMIVLLFNSLKHFTRLTSKIIVVIPFLYVCLVAFFANGNNPINPPSNPFFSKSYVEKIEKLFTDKIIENPIGAFCKAPSDYTDIFRKSSLVYSLGYYMPIFHPNAHQLALSVFEIPLDTNYIASRREKIFIESTPFFMFVQEQKTNNQFHSIEASQVDFIKKNKIEYLIISDSYNLSDTLKSLVETEIVDSLSKERFLLLKH